MSNGVFEVLADDHSQERIASTRAVIAAQTRAKQRFEKFVSTATTQEERDARIALIASDLDGVLQGVNAEYGTTDLDHLRNAATVALGGGHASDCACGFCENKGKLPGQKDDDSDDESDPSEPGAKGNDEPDERHEYESSVSTSKIDVKQAAASASEFPWDETVVASDTTEKLAMAVSKRDFEAISAILKQNGADPSIAQQIAEYFATQNQNFDHDRFMDASGVGQLQAPLARAVIAAVTAADVETGDSFAQERVDVASGPDASPKIDKSKVPANGLSAIDVPSKAHPNEQQSVTDTADYAAKDFDPGSPTRDRIDADKALQPEHNVADNTQTWTGTEGLAQPVTSAVLGKWTVLP